MKNLLILVVAILIALSWLLQNILASHPTVEREEKKLEEITIETESTLNINTLANTFGVEFQQIKTEPQTQPQVVDVELALISIYTSGEVAMARVKANTSGGDVIKNIRAGDSLYQYKVEKVDVNSITLTTDSAEHLQLKIFKPLTVSVKTPAADEEV